MLGPNGAGKTTMLQMLATLLPIDGGERRDLRRRRARRTRTWCASCSASPASTPRSTRTSPPARTSACSAGCSGCRRSRGPRDRATSLLEQFGLEDAADKPISKFSGGMRRRLDLAASLITRPPLIFLDEPTTGLDPRTRGQMWDTIRDLVARRLHGAAHHAVPRRGRPARRPDRGHRPRPQGRRGHPRRAQGLGRHARRCSCGWSTRRDLARPRRRRAPACSASEPVLTPEARRHQRRRCRRRPGRRRADRPARAASIADRRP